MAGGRRNSALWVSSVPRAALLVLTAGLSGLAVAPVVKAAIGRLRPEVVEQLAPAASAAFPSAHSMNAMLVYLMLALVAAQLLEDRQVGRLLAVFALLLALIVGLTRVYLGVHWPGDVLAGWALGAAWAAFWVGWAVQRGWFG